MRDTYTIISKSGLVHDIKIWFDYDESYDEFGRKWYEITDWEFSLIHYTFNKKKDEVPPYVHIIRENNDGTVDYETYREIDKYIPGYDGIIEELLERLSHGEYWGFYK